MKTKITNNESIALCVSDASGVVYFVGSVAMSTYEDLVVCSVNKDTTLAPKGVRKIFLESDYIVAAKNALEGALERPLMVSLLRAHHKDTDLVRKGIHLREVDSRSGELREEGESIPLSRIKVVPGGDGLGIGLTRTLNKAMAFSARAYAGKVRTTHLGEGFEKASGPAQRDAEADELVSAAVCRAEENRRSRVAAPFIMAAATTAPSEAEESAVDEPAEAFTPKATPRQTPRAVRAPRPRLNPAAVRNNPAASAVAPSSLNSMAAALDGVIPSGAE